MNAPANEAPDQPKEKHMTPSTTAKTDNQAKAERSPTALAVRGSSVLRCGRWMSAVQRGRSSRDGLQW